MKTIKVIYIAGDGRSGSTLLDRMLGQLPGFFSTGEMRLIWERSFEDDQLCGCGASFRQCPFWEKIVSRTFGEFQKVDTEIIKEQRHLVQRTRYLPQLLYPGLRSKKFNDALNNYSRILSKMYQEVAAESGSHVIIDSSKDPLHALVLNSIEEIDLSIIHLVRNSRAVAYSWQRKKIRPEIAAKKELMPRYSPWESSWRWNKANILCLLIKVVKPQYQLLRYEDLITSPALSINTVLEKFDMKERLPATENENIVYLKTNHMVSGNPMRFSRGEITIRIDKEWQGKMPVMHRLIVFLMTWPLLIRLGYN